MITCSVVGATSYTGNELIRILARHPEVELGLLTSRSDSHVRARDFVPALGKRDDLVVRKYHFKEVARASDVIFLTLPHTAGMKITGDLWDAGKVVIDLSADFRLRSVKVYEQWYQERHQRKDLLKHAVYGLSEFYRKQIQESNLIANPGCYPTGAALGLYPLLRNGLIASTGIKIDAKSGASGAGKKLSEATQFCEVDENFGAYKVNRHQHMPEIEQTLSEASGKAVHVTFVPHLLPVNRGILSTIYTRKEKGIHTRKIVKTFEAFAEAHPFVRFLGLDRFPTLRNVQHTNFCDIGVAVDERTDDVIVITAIDNLLKGASGQAVQNMNIRFGFPEELGLLD